MITKDNYHRVKHYLKSLSKPQVKNLCVDMELSEFEKNLLLAMYDNELVTKICMDNFICETTYNKYIKSIYTKVYNYLIYLNTSF